MTLYFQTTSGRATSTDCRRCWEIALGTHLVFGLVASLFEELIALKIWTCSKDMKMLLPVGPP